MGLSGTLAPPSFVLSAANPATELCREVTAQAGICLERRIPLNRSSKRAGRFVASVVFAITVGVGSASYQVHAEQQASATENLSAEQVEDLLAQARMAMKSADLQRAESLLQRAESAKVNYPVLHFGDKPEKVRQDLDRLKAQQGTPPASSQPQTVVNSFVDGASSAGNALVGDRYSTSSHNASAQPLPGAATSSAPHLAVPQLLKAEPSQQQATAHLLAARRALVLGDTVQASKYVTLARQTGASFGPAADSPDRIEQSIRERAMLESTKNDSPTWRHSYARFLVSQAGLLIEHGDLDRAEQVSHEVAGMNVAFEIADTTPADVLSRVARIRAGQNKVAPTAEQPPAPALAKSQTLNLLADARQALQSGDLAQAESLAGRASQLGVPETAFAAQEESPSRFAADLARARAESQAIQLATTHDAGGLRLPGAVEPAQGIPHLAQAPENMLTPLPTVADNSLGNADPYAIISQAEQALRNGNRAEALRLFESALSFKGELDPITHQRLEDHLQMLSGASGSQNAQTKPGRGSSLLNSAGSDMKLLARQLSADVGRQQSEAAKIRGTDPQGALQLLADISTEVEQSELEEGMKRQLQRRISMTVAETERFIKDNKAELELDAANREVLDEIERAREVKLQVQERLAELNDQYNQLRDEHRFAEMEVIAKRAYEMAPEDPVAQLMWTNAKFIRREMLNREISSDSEEAFANNLLRIRETAAEAGLQSDTPITYNADTWNQLKNRKGSSDPSSRRTARELEIEQKLKTPVLPRYQGTPLSEVVEQLSQLTGVNIHLDELGLGQEGVRSDEPVNLNLKREVSLKSALNLILEPMHLTYMIKDEVLKVTSEEIRDGEVFPQTYNVADLVIPIPNFVPSSDIGLQGLINDAYAALPQNVRNYPGPVAMVPSAAGGPSGPESMVPGGVLPQQFGAPGGSSPVSYGSGSPGGAGGAANADFDSLIDLIVSTVEHDSWMENGTGDGEIQPFPTNLSLVISQTQRVHEQIADLLEQLRRLQDLQVTIEVRFIRLNDSFFERIGIDFDFNIEDETGIVAIDTTGSPTEPSEPSAIVGLQANPVTSGDALGTFTSDLDIPFRNSSAALGVPTFGTPQDVASFGFAILSDIEAYFLINASQGNSRTNVLSAPKVTLFNGQQAIVLDTAFQPFVISVIPVVGEFAAAQQPVIVVLSEGTMLTVQAVVSDDRRYVRLTLVPFFSEIGDVDTFTFEGSETTTTTTANTDADDDGNDESADDSSNVVRSGTTVQLPTFQVISVSTTVSVPDGGTVLLGGIKRLSEQRTEFGVPLLGKVPYIDRLFRNVGLGRDTESLMLMVTPHIIIQEEEEERLGIE